MDGTGELFGPLLEKLPITIKCAVISYKKDKTQSYKELVEYVHNLLPINDDYIIVAESFSGPIAFELAKNKDPNLKSVIFVASFLRPPNTLLKLIKWFPLSLFLRLPIPTKFIKKYMLGEEVNNELIRKLRDVLAKIDTNVLSYRLRQIASLNIKSTKLDTRAIYLQPTSDKLVPENNFVDFKNSIENLRISRVPGPHFLLQANPSECSAIIETEIRELTKN